MTIVEPKLIVSLDIGNSKIVMIAGEVMPDGFVTILGKAEMPSYGYKQGSVTDYIGLLKGIKDLKAELESFIGYEINDVIVSISTKYIHSFDRHSSVYINDTVKESDIDISMNDLVNLRFDGYSVLHLLPQDYQIDNLPYTKNPVGVKGRRLVTNAHYIITNNDYLVNIINVIEHADLNIVQFVYSAMADSYANLSNDEKELGACLINIGGGSINILIYLGGSIRYSKNLPYGGDNITEFLAKTYTLNLLEAERVKLFGSAILCDSPESLAVKTIDGRDILLSKEEISKHTARCYTDLLSVVKFDIDTLSQNLNRDISRELMAGVVITGGGSEIKGLKECANNVLGLPVRIATVDQIGGLTDMVSSSAYSTAVGLLKYNILNYEEIPDPPTFFDKVIYAFEYGIGKIYNFIKKTF